MSRAPTRDEAKRHFWRDVKDLLIKEYGHTDSQAQHGLAQYNSEVVPRLGEVVYNQGEEQAAKVIDGIIRKGLPWPTKKSRAKPA